jgi:hypothetical protein
MVSELSSALDYLLRYFELKMVIRHQDIEIIPVDFVWTREVGKQLEMDTNNVELNNNIDATMIIIAVNTIAQGYEAMKDMCQGPCRPNQNGASPVLRETPHFMDVIGCFLANYTNKNSVLNKDNMLYTIKELKQSINQAEFRIVKFLSAVVEGASQEKISEVTSSLDESILFRNLDRAYKLCVKGSWRARKLAKVLAVAYMSLLLTLADNTELSDHNPLRSDNMQTWIKKWSSDGYDTSAFIASVEIMDKNGQVDRVYFPIPDFVNKYWSYPEVQLCKDEIMWDVVRTSPEEKVSKINTNADKIIYDVKLDI